MIKGFKIFPFMDKNDPNEDADIPNVDSHDLFISGGKNPPERLNHDKECFGAYMELKYSFVDKCDPKRRIYIPNTDIFVSFVSGGKNPLDRGNHIIDLFDANEDIFFPYKDYFNLDESIYIPFISRVYPSTY